MQDKDNNKQQESNCDGVADFPLYGTIICFILGIIAGAITKNNLVFIITFVTLTAVSYFVFHYYKKKKIKTSK